jgi:glutathione S-transferase
MKGIDCVGVRLTYDDAAMKEWAPRLSAPAVVYGNEPPRTGWAEILLLAERLSPSPALLPANAAERALVFGLSHEICGEQGLGWSRRLQLVHAGLNGAGGFVEPIAKYLAKKYGYRAHGAGSLEARVTELLGMLAARLKAQRSAGSTYYVGNTPTAADVYSATVMALFAPLPEAQCATDPYTRAAFETLDAATAAALDPVLLEHRDLMYTRHLALPLSL